MSPQIPPKRYLRQTALGCVLALCLPALQSACSLAPTAEAPAAAADQPDVTARKLKGLKAQSAGHYETAWELLLPIAEQGDAEAEYQMGWLSEIGWPGFDGDLQQAAAWYRKAAQHGNTAAQLWLGYQLAGRMAVDASGQREPEEVNEGVHWLKLAADSGNQEAQLMLGDIYTEGRGPVQQDLEQAQFWLGKAADQGNSLARIILNTPRKPD